jgi:hypothetical protein
VNFEYGTLILDIGQLDTAGNKEQPMDSLIIAIIIIVHMIRLMIGNILIITKIGALQAKDSVFGAHHLTSMELANSQKGTIRRISKLSINLNGLPKLVKHMLTSMEMDNLVCLKWLNLH